MKRVISLILTAALMFTCFPMYCVKAEEGSQNTPYSFEEVMQADDSGLNEAADDAVDNVTDANTGSNADSNADDGNMDKDMAGNMESNAGDASDENVTGNTNSGAAVGMDSNVTDVIDSDVTDNTNPAADDSTDNGEDQDINKAYSFEEAKAIYESGKGTLVTCSDWTNGGSFGSNYWALATGSGSITAEAIDVEGEDFDKALNVCTDKKADNSWDTQIFFKITGKVEAGDTLFYGFKMKGIRSETTPGLISVNTRIRPSNDSGSSTNFDVTGSTDGEWEQFYGSMVSTVSTSDSASGYGTWVFQVGMAAQEFQLADLFIVNVSREPGLEDDTEEEPGVVYTFDEVMQLFRDGKGELVTYPGLFDEGAYNVEYQDNINESNFIVKEINVSNQEFSEALNVATTETGSVAWDAQIYINMDRTRKIEKNDVLFVGCKVRGISSVTNKEAMFVTANTRIRPDRSTSVNFDFTSQINADDMDDWTQIYAAVNAPAASTDQTDGAWVFQLSSAVQELDIADVFVINFGKEFSKNQFPVMAKSYLGMEEDAQWRQEALERIEQIRKADVTVKVVDEQGQPVEDAQVKVEQTRHAFGFGTIVNVDSYNKLSSATQEKYKEAFSMIAHNRAGFENALKSNYITDQERQTLVDDWLNYFETQDIDVRGHVLIYGQDSRLNNVGLNGTVTDLENKDLLTADTDEGRAALREWTQNHIQTYVNKYKGRIYNWDVVNENMTSHNWSDRLGGYDALVEWFREAYEADPDAKLTYNDYGILSRDSGHQDYHYNLCKYLVDNGAPITTIGIQGHVSLISPTEVIRILDRFSELGKEIEITEFTYEDDDPELQAQFTRDFMIAVFSEEAVTSMTTWGFWEGCMYQPKAAMFDSNFNLKPNGEVWMDLVYNQWWTNESGMTDASGVYNTRAFLGNHNITVTAGDKEYTYPVVLDKNGTEIVVSLDGTVTPGIHEHYFSSDWSGNADYHWHACACGEKTELAAHVAGEWIVDKEADTEEAGSRHKECIVCGAVLEIEEIPAADIKNDDDNTDDAGGNGNVNGDDSVNNNGNNNSDGSVNNNANNNSDGSVNNNVNNNNDGSVDNNANNNGSSDKNVNVDKKVNNNVNNNVNNSGGKNSGTASSVKEVRTGDTNHVILWILLIVLAGGVLVICRK